MGKILVLAEKPSQAVEYTKLLKDKFSKKDGYFEGDRFVVTFGVGHLIGLADADAYNPAFGKWSLDQLPIIPTDFMYHVLPKTSSQFTNVKKLLKRSDIDKIIVATDCDREGELIARLILKQAGSNKPTFRFWTSNALTTEVVNRGMANAAPLADFDNLSDAAHARSIGDWLFGINATRLFTKKLDTLFTLGRVQTPTLRLIVDRDNAIKNFVPQDYFILRASFGHPNGGYAGTWFRPKADANAPAQETAEDADSTPQGAEETGSRVTSADEAKAILERVKAAGKGVVQSAVTEDKQQPPPLLYSFTELAKVANRAFGLSASDTLAIAQDLYEKYKVLSYPRTSNQYLDPSQAGHCEAMLAKLHKSGFVEFDLSRCSVNAGNKRTFRVVQGASHMALAPEGVPSASLPERHAKVFRLVVERFVQAFLPNYKYKSTTIVTQVGEDVFKTTGSVMVDKGWKAVGYRASTEDSELPSVKQRDSVDVTDAESEAKQTTPPPRFTEDTLLEAMSKLKRYVEDPQLKAALGEKAGLGTDATRPAIIERLKSTGYIEIEKKHLVPTQKGIFLIECIKGTQFADPVTTAIWEEKLAQIADGEGTITGSVFVQEMGTYIRTVVEAVKASAITAPAGMSGGDIGSCPICGSDMYAHKAGYSCRGGDSEPKCRFIIFGTLCKGRITKEAVKDLLHNLKEKNGKKVLVRGMKSKAGNSFDAYVELVPDEKYGFRTTIAGFPERGASKKSYGKKSFGNKKRFSK